MSTRAVSQPTTASDLLSLTKPRLSSLVELTMLGGMWIAPASRSPSQLAVALLSTAGIIGSANALNCYLERDVDRLMRRTQSRPLPAGRMDPAVAFRFGIFLAAISIPALGMVTNLLTAMLGLSALALYVLVYTPLKARTWKAMFVGAVPGALPTLMGWTAVTGSIALPGLVLFAILFLWQIPHFLAIALFCKEEYAAANLKSLPLEKGDAVARGYVVFYCAVLIPVTLALYPLKVAGPIYFATALVLGAAFLGTALHGYWRELGPDWARKLFRVSLFHMAGLFVALWLDGGARASRWILK